MKRYVGRTRRLELLRPSTRHTGQPVARQARRPVIPTDDDMIGLPHLHKDKACYNPSAYLSPHGPNPKEGQLGCVVKRLVEFPAGLVSPDLGSLDMKYRTGQLTTSQPIRSASQKLVATRHAPGRGPKRSEYDSSDRLPDIARLLDSTVQKIQGIHLVRGRSQGSFDRLWEQVCAKLAELGNASAYARWKQNDTSLNLDEFQELDTAVAKAWALGRMPINPDVSDSPFLSDDRQFQRAKEERSALKLEIDISIDHVLEVVIAYWIEAMNDHKDGDELRAMNALIQCHFNLGIAHALRMTHDTKADDGRQAGLKERDALAKVVLEVMQNFIVTKSIHNDGLLLEGITHALEADPAYEKVLRAYDAPAIGDERKKDSIGIRFPRTLKTWITGKKPLYPDLALQFQSLAQQIEKRPTIRNIVRRKASG